MKNFFPKEPSKARSRSKTTSVATRFSGTTTYLHVKNTKFIFNEDASINLKWFLLKATPFDTDNFYDLDDIYSYAYDILGGESILEFSVLGKIFNKHILNFKGAPLRNLSFSTVLDANKARKLVIKGGLRLVRWLPFTMTATMTLDKEKGLIVLTVDEISTMGVVPAHKFMNAIGVSLKNLITLPEDLAVNVKGNALIIKPLLLFPAPLLTGELSGVKLREEQVDISFKELEKVRVPQRPEPTAPNDFFLFGGDVKIAQSRYINMNIQIFDREPREFFEFHIKEYFKQVSEGVIRFRHEDTIAISALSYSKL